MTRNSYQSLSHSQRKSVSSSACFERDLSLYFSMNFYIEAHQYRRCEQFRELTIWKHWLLLTLIPGKGSCTVWKRGSTKQWSLWVTKLLSSFLLLKAPNFKALAWALYLQGLRLKLVLMEDWPPGHVWLCPGLSHALTRNSWTLKEDGTHLETIGNTCEINWCLKHFVHLRDSFKLGAGGSQRRHSFLPIQLRGPFTVQSATSLYPRIRKLLEQSFRVQRCLVLPSSEGIRLLPTTTGENQMSFNFSPTS